MLSYANAAQVSKIAFKSHNRNRLKGLDVGFLVSNGLLGIICSQSGLQVAVADRVMSSTFLLAAMK